MRIIKRIDNLLFAGLENILTPRAICSVWTRFRSWSTWQNAIDPAFTVHTAWSPFQYRFFIPSFICPPYLLSFMAKWELSQFNCWSAFDLTHNDRSFFISARILNTDIKVRPPSVQNTSHGNIKVEAHNSFAIGVFAKHCLHPLSEKWPFRTVNHHRVWCEFQSDFVSFSDRIQ